MPNGVEELLRKKQILTLREPWSLGLQPGRHTRITRITLKAQGLRRGSFARGLLIRRHLSKTF
jgi:hypothetical protein